MTADLKFRGDDAGTHGEAAGVRATDVRHLIALTNDPALQKALEELAGLDAGASIVVVADMRSLTDELMQQNSATALIDAASIDVPVEGAVDAISTQFPDLRLLVAGHGLEQNMLATRIANQSVFRFVHKPASPQRLRLFLDAAARPGDRPGAVHTATAPAGRESRARTNSGTRGKAPPIAAIIGGVALVAISVVAWTLWSRSDASRTPAAVAAVDNSPAVAELVRRAMLAFAAGKYVASDGSSSAELYRQALQLEPGSSAAESGYNRALEYGLRTAEEALLAGRVADADALAESLRRIAPNNSRLEFLTAQISRELARVNTDVAQRQAFETRQTVIRAALDRMAERIRAAAFLDPATSSAVAYFREAEAAGAADPAVRGARELLVAAMLTAADNELSARRVSAARRLLDAVGAINNRAPGLDVLRRRMDEVGGAASTSAQAIEQPTRPETAPPAAAAQAAPQPSPAATQLQTQSPEAAATAGPVAASSLKVLRKQAPEYPERALLQLVSGWVDLEFTVTRDGSVKDVVVVNSEPGRTFDSVATKALLRYRYEPVIRNGEAVQLRARIRMRFTAQDAQ